MKIFTAHLAVITATLAAMVGCYSGNKKSGNQSKTSPSAVLQQFTVDKPHINYGEEVTLSWKLQGEVNDLSIEKLENGKVCETIPLLSNESTFTFKPKHRFAYHLKAGDAKSQQIIIAAYGAAKIDKEYDEGMFNKSKVKTSISAALPDKINVSISTPSGNTYASLENSELWVISPQGIASFITRTQYTSCLAINSDETIIWGSCGLAKYQGDGKYPPTINTIYEVNLKTGEVKTISGLNGTEGNNDGPAAQATYKNPRNIIFDERRNSLLICDTWNRRIRRLDFQTSQVTTITGAKAKPVKPSFDPPTGIPGTLQDAVLPYPTEMVLTHSGDVTVRVGTWELWQITLPD